MISLPYSAPNWTTAPISCTCERLDALKDGIHKVPKFCGKPTTYAYPAMGGGWMPLCEEHGRQHLPHAFHIDDLVRSGEVFENGASKDDLVCRCECGAEISTDDLAVGYTNLMTGLPICEACWEKGGDEA